MISPSFVRRAMDSGMTMFEGGNGEEMKQLPTWGAILLMCTAVLFVVAMVTVCLPAVLHKSVANDI